VSNIKFSLLKTVTNNIVSLDHGHCWRLDFDPRTRTAKRTLAVHYARNLHLSHRLGHPRFLPKSRYPLSSSIHHFIRHLLPGTLVHWSITANLHSIALQGAETAVILGLGNSAYFVPSNVFITAQAPHYPVGFGTGLGLTAFALPVMLLLMFVFKKHSNNIDKKISALQPDEELEDQVDYKYVY
jgi:hypothetical protein